MVSKEDEKRVGKVKRVSAGQLLSWMIAPSCSMGARLRSGKDENIESIISRIRYGGAFTLTGWEHLAKRHDSAKGGWEEAEEWRGAG